MEIFMCSEQTSKKFYVNFHIAMILEHYLVARVPSYFDILSGTVILNLSSPKQYEETGVFEKHERQFTHFI